MSLLLTLPNELLLQVGESMEDPRDVNSLIRVNHRLHSLLTPHLHALALQPRECPVLPLCWAAWKGHAPLVRLLLSKGAHPETPDPENGDTALHYALTLRLQKNPTSPILQDLLEHTTDPNVPSPQDGSTLLHRAAASANADEELALLLSTPKIDVNACIAATGDTPLTRAVSMNHPAAVKLLLHHGADPNVLTAAGQSPLSLAVKLENAQVVTDLLRHSADAAVCLPLDGQTVLHQAACANSEGMVRLLLRRGVCADVANRQGRTPLDVAVLLGCEGAAEVLLQGGAKVDVWSEEGGETALFRAVRYCPSRVPLISLLVKHGADFRGVGSRAEGKSVLEFARECGYPWVVDICEGFERGGGGGGGKGRSANKL